MPLPFSELGGGGGGQCLMTPVLQSLFNATGSTDVTTACIENKKEA